MNRSYDEAELSSANAQWRMRVPKAVERELEEEEELELEMEME